ncbi:MAG: chorismate synthase [Paludibacteraceae bacterium]|nr:chorismate synthase [Paludibacteraceae bacterium]
MNSHNTFGERFTFTSFGESHGIAVGGVLDGVPAGLKIDMNLIRDELNRRSGKGQTATSPRARIEADEVEWLSGVKDGISLGTPIAFILRNTQQKSEDYEVLKHMLRPGHADFTYLQKYGIRDYRGGGRASARETASRVAAGAIAKQLLIERGITIEARLTQVGVETDPERMKRLLEEVTKDGDSIGGIVTCTINGLPAGVGEPIFDKLQSLLAHAILSINGCKGFEYGTGFGEMHLRGSEIYHPEQVPCPRSGGIEGGISNGLPVVFRCAFKPAATIRQLYGGRHDACIAVRAVPVVEAMAALTLCDLMNENQHQNQDESPDENEK